MFKGVSLVVAAAAVATFIGLAVSDSAKATVSTDCVDGSKSGNLSYQWTGYDKVSVSTKNGKAVCKDTTVFFSAYVMPDSWDGKGWNQTAVPQTLHGSVSATFKAGQKAPKADLKLTMPEECKNVQVDLYYAPEQKRVTWTEKIGDRLIAAKHKKGSGKCYVPPVVKDIKVCELATKKVITIKETAYDSKKHSKNLDACKEKPVVKTIEVCELSTKKVVTIKESDFDAKKHSKSLDDCKETPVTPEEPKGKGEEPAPEVPAELPQTGTSANLLLTLFGAAGAYATVYRLRK